MAPGVRKAKELAPPADRVARCPAGVQGHDEITFGGLPRRRPTLVSGTAGCGKRGATQFNEPGVCLTFEAAHLESGQLTSRSSNPNLRESSDRNAKTRGDRQ